jgi:hypothetical protein
MRLTRAKSIELCIELWTWLAETGKGKEDWPEWEKYGDIEQNCWFCEYDTQRLSINLEDDISDDCCKRCPLGGEFNKCLDMYYYQWYYSVGFIKDRKKYAKLFLEQIKALRK